ncbi:VanW family protein [Lysinibacillus sp. 3P01SB]|uniref:VanW family protein n=1 Tax=Lysinibacillus sp. 3P01SB TaxID=3132284 RepID=UPI0039A56A40
MKKLIIIMVFLTVGLAGCQGKSDKERQLEEQIKELEQQLEESQQQVSYEESPADTSEEEPVLKLIDPITSKVVRTFSPIELGYEMDINAYIKEIEELAKELARGTDSVHGYDKKMVLDRIDENGQLMKGSPMVILREDELVEKMIAASDTGGEILLPLYETESGYEEQDIAVLDEVKIASFTTYFNANEKGRNKNIELSAKSLNNVIVGSGDHFSFNTMVGRRSEERGYQPAKEIINGELVMGIGGGICQTSSTLFNAVDKLPITIVERHHHSLDIGYVPKGRDATVSYGSLDFRFQNTSGVPFILKTVYFDGVLTVEAWTSKEYEILLEALQ